MTNENTGTTFTAQQKGHPITAEQLKKMIESMPETPKILAMEYKTFMVYPNEYLPNNTIIVSMDFAKKMGWVK